MIAALIIAQALAWIGGFVLVVREILAADRGPERLRPDLWIVQSDHASCVRALRDAGPYDWAADEPAGGAA